MQYVGTNLAGINLLWVEGEDTQSGFPTVYSRYITFSLGVYWDHNPIAGVGFCWCEGEGFQGPHCTLYLYTFNAATGYREDAIPCPLGPMLPNQPALPWGEMLP